MAFSSTPAYYDTATLTAVKKFIVEVLRVFVIVSHFHELGVNKLAYYVILTLRICNIIMMFHVIL
jgi:hypothetical protein